MSSTKSAGPSAVEPKLAQLHLADDVAGVDVADIVTMGLGVGELGWWEEGASLRLVELVVDGLLGAEVLGRDLIDGFLPELSGERLIGDCRFGRRFGVVVFTGTADSGTEKLREGGFTRFEFDTGTGGALVDAIYNIVFER